MTGRDIHRVLQRGAVAAQMGTAFLCCDESGTSPAHNRLLMNEPHRGVAYTRAFSGRSAQGLRNRFIDRMSGARYLPFPLQNTLTSGMRKQAVLQDDAEYQSLWAGTAYAQVRAMSAAQLMNTLQREYVLARKPLTD
jgi:nitronate monooxygenase